MIYKYLWDGSWDGGEFSPIHSELNADLALSVLSLENREVASMLLGLRNVREMGDTRIVLDCEYEIKYSRVNAVLVLSSRPLGKDELDDLVPSHKNMSQVIPPPEDLVPPKEG